MLDCSKMSHQVYLSRPWQVSPHGGPVKTLDCSKMSHLVYLSRPCQVRLKLLCRYCSVFQAFCRFDGHTSKHLPLPRSCPCYYCRCYYCRCYYCRCYYCRCFYCRCFYYRCYCCRCYYSRCYYSQLPFLIALVMSLFLQFSFQFHLFLPAVLCPDAQLSQALDSSLFEPSFALLNHSSFGAPWHLF
jgi:hypothetical protein